MAPRTCVDPDGVFRVGIHQPTFEVNNLRENIYPDKLGALPDGTLVDNRVNFPKDNVKEPGADRIYEIANPFPFRGATFINSAWADTHAGKPDTIGIPKPTSCSFVQSMEAWHPLTSKDKTQLLALLPHPLCIALAQASTDPEELMILAKKACTLLFEKDDHTPWGIGYKTKKDGSIVPDIHDPEVFEVLVNNPNLPDAYKKALVLKPGVQGTSEIIGEVGARDKDSHVFEYLRRNSYIPWGHFAANMADDAIRYRAKDLTKKDMSGLRHLYYQRVYARVAAQLGIAMPAQGKCLDPDQLETLRRAICKTLASGSKDLLAFNGALWGWNFGFGFAQSGHRLHASHQMIHQQNSMVPEKILDNLGDSYDCFSCGDLLTGFIAEFKLSTGKHFFDAYLSAIQNNERTDKNAKGENSLIVHEDDWVILFAPKAQVSEWELQLMTKTPCSNVLEADIAMRTALDQAMLTAIQVLEKLGAKMVTAIELSGRFDRPDTGQHLVYSFIPRLPYAPGTFSEAQLRWISGCYPEDFAHACRRAIVNEKSNTKGGSMILHDITYDWDGKSKLGEKPISWWPGSYRVRIVKLGDDTKEIQYLFPIAVIFKSQKIAETMNTSLKNYIDNFAKKISETYDLEIEKTLWVELSDKIRVAQLHPDRKLSNETLYTISWRPARPNELSMIDPYIKGL